MFLLPLLLIWLVALWLARQALLARSKLMPNSLWRYWLLAAALVLAGLVGWSLLAIVTADSLW